MVSVPASTPPPASPNKPGQARGAPVHIHVSVPEVPRVASLSCAPSGTLASSTASRASTPSGKGAASIAPLASTSSVSLASQPSGGTSTPPAASPASARAPPSSSKRMLAPNGQPRKIPMAMDFNDGERWKGVTIQQHSRRSARGVWPPASILPCLACILPHALTPGPPLPPPSFLPLQWLPPTWRTGRAPTAGLWALARRPARRCRPMRRVWAPLPPLLAAPPRHLWRPSAPWWATTAGAHAQSGGTEGYCWAAVALWLVPPLCQAALTHQATLPFCNRSTYNTRHGGSAH